MQKTRAIIGLLAAFAVLGLLAACGGSEPTPTSTAPAPTPTDGPPTATPMALPPGVTAEPTPTSSGPSAADIFEAEWAELITAAQGDGKVVIALGGSSNSRLTGWEDFQEIDQVSIMKPITKWSAQCNSADRLPEFVSMAFRKCWGNRPGPVYIDLPGDVLHQKVDEANVHFPINSRTESRPMGDPAAIKEAIKLLSKA